MKQSVSVPSPDRDWNLRWLLVVLLAALAFGVYGRFAGLGAWPFGVDEFYLSRSVDHVVRTGLPQFACGGLYLRGLTFQYALALLRSVSHLSPELSARLISAAASLAGLPAVYLLGRRLGGRILGVLLLIIISVSVWEIEMARFARMYAPFQTIFLWYLLYLLRYVLDGEKTALLPMVLLSVLGALTWEGGALLGVTNLLPPLLQLERRRLRASDTVYFAGMLLLLVGLLALSDSALLFPDESASTPDDAADTGSMIGGWQVYREHAGWMLLFLLGPMTLAAASMRWIWSLRSRPLAALGAAVTLISALMHQFVLCGACGALLALSGLVTTAELRRRAARAYFLCLGSCALFWLVFGLATRAWSEIVPAGGVHSTHRWLALAQHLGGFPNVFGEIARPWGRTLPLLSVSAAILLGLLIIQVVRNPTQQQMRAPRVLLITLLLLMLAVGAREPGRVETRYTFFLYPLVLALSLSSIQWLVRSRLGASRAALAGASVLCLLFFGLTGDFKPLHVATIDSWQTNFRIGMSAIMADHYYPHSDYRSAAAWLAQHAQRGDTVIIGIQSIDQYYHQADFFFLRAGDIRYDEDACDNGAVERWTNLPLLYKTDALAAQVATGRRIFLVLYPDEAQHLLEEGQRRNWSQQLAWASPDHGITVTLINPS